jgi:DNA cross-link repair 1C protein
VEYIARHPVLLPYTSGVKALDKIYLDTSCCFSECRKFNSKVSMLITICGDVSLMFVMQREGIAILLKKLSRYPQDTIFHLNTWTFGYEV